MIELSLFEGDAFNRALARVGLGRERSHWVARRMVAAWALTWGVLALLSAISGVLVGPTPRETFLIDFAAYGQFWIAVPLLLGAEAVIDRRFRMAVDLFDNSGLVRDADRAHFESVVQAANRTKHWWWLDLLLFASTYLLAWIWLAGELSNSSGSWHARLSAGRETITLPGIWLFLVGIPIYNMMLLRWVSKVLIWYRVLWRVSRLELSLNVGHPDLAGGLGFLGDLQATFGALIFAVGSAVATTVGYKISIERSEALTAATAGPIIAFVLLAPAIFLLPLLFFTRQLYWAKARGIYEYTLAAGHYVKGFEAKWLRQGSRPSEDFLSTGDIQSFADTGTVFETIHKMRIFPFDFGTALRLLLSAGGPMLPLLAKSFPQVRPYLDFLL